jgi:hypothetical protein
MPVVASDTLRQRRGEMRIRPGERQEIAEICREEMSEAERRIGARLAQFECRPPSNGEDVLDGIRRFYEDLTDKAWTDGDEEALRNLGDLGEGEIKRMMREGFRRSRVYPVPNFNALINALRKDSDITAEAGVLLANLDAISAVERERIANMLHKELAEAAREIAERLRLGEKGEVVREQLERVEGNIISGFTPLV